MANSFSGGQCSRTAKKFFGASVDAPSSFLFLEGRAPARPKDSGTTEVNDDDSVGASPDGNF